MLDIKQAIDDKGGMTWKRSPIGHWVTTVDGIRMFAYVDHSRGCWIGYAIIGGEKYTVCADLRRQIPGYLKIEMES